MKKRKGLSKRTFIGSMLVLTLILLMPSIPAVQVNSIESATRNDKVNKINDLDFKEEIINIFKTGQKIKYPILFIIVRVIAEFRLIRSYILKDISSSWPPGWRWPIPNIQYPLLFLRAEMLSYTTGSWLIFWIYLSNLLSWNWYQ